LPQLAHEALVEIRRKAWDRRSHGAAEQTVYSGIASVDLIQGSVTGISLLFHHALEKQARAMQVRLRGVLGNTRQQCYFANSRAEPIVEPQGRLVYLGERSNALRKGVIALRRFGLPVRSRLPGYCVIEGRFVRMGTSEADPRFQVYRLVKRDSVDPGAEFGLAAERLKGVVNFEEHFLHHIFRFRNEFAAQNRNRESEDLSTMAANQFGKSLLVAVLRACRELGIALQVNCRD
jgi:hypothetical protein